MPIIILKDGRILDTTTEKHERLLQVILMSTEDTTIKVEGVKFKVSDIEDDMDKINKRLKSA